MPLIQLTIRSELEKTIHQIGGTIHGSGTDLTSGIMDISFSVDGQAYRIDLRKVEKYDRKV